MTRDIDRVFIAHFISLLKHVGNHPHVKAEFFTITSKLHVLINMSHRMNTNARFMGHPEPGSPHRLTSLVLFLDEMDTLTVHLPSFQREDVLLCVLLDN